MLKDKRIFLILGEVMKVLRQRTNPIRIDKTWQADIARTCLPVAQLYRLT